MANSKIISDGPEAITLECKNTEMSFYDIETKEWFKLLVKDLAKAKAKANVNTSKWHITGPKNGSKIVMVHYCTASKRGTYQYL